MPEKILFVSIDDASEGSKQLLKQFIQSTIPQNAIINILNETEEEAINGESLGDIIDITYLVDYSMKDKVLDELNSNNKYRGKLNAYEADVNVNAEDPNDQIISTRSLYGINVDENGGSIIDFDKTQTVDQEDDHEYVSTDYEKVDLDNLLSDIFEDSNEEADLSQAQNELSHGSIDIASDLANMSDAIDDLLPSPNMILKELNPKMNNVNPTDTMGLLLKNQYQNMLTTSYTIMSDNIAKVSSEQLAKDIQEFKKSINSQNIPELNDYNDARNSLLEYESKAVEKANEIKNAYSTAMDAWIESQKPALIDQFKSENEDHTDEQLAAFMETVKADKEVFNREIAKIKEDAMSELLIRFIQQCKSEQSKDAMKFLTLKKQAEEEAKAAIEMLGNQGSQQFVQQQVSYDRPLEQVKENRSISYNVTAGQTIPQETINEEKTVEESISQDYVMTDEDNESFENMLNEYNLDKMQDDGFNDSIDSLDDSDFISEEELSAEIERLANLANEDDVTVEEADQEEPKNIEETINYQIPEFNEEELMNDSDDDEDEDNEYYYDDSDEDNEYYYDDENDEDGDDYYYDDDDDDDDEDSSKQSRWKKYVIILLASIGIGGLGYGSYLMLNESKSPAPDKTEQSSKQSESKPESPKSNDKESNQASEKESKDSKSKESSASEGKSKYAKVGDKIAVTDDKQIFNVTITSINKDGSANAKDSDGKTWKLSEAILKKWAEKNKNKENEDTQQSQQESSENK